MGKSEAKWQEVDPTSLSTKAQKAYNEYKRLYREAKAARESFEEQVNDEAGLPASHRVIFGYNFGKLSMAVVEGEAKAKAKPVAPKLNLAQFLAAQAGQGRRA
jgi:hypothetical protein